MAELTDGWSLAVTPSGACAGPAEAAKLTDWIPAPVPGTAALALERAGRWRRAAPEPLHDKDVWYRVSLPDAGRRRLCFEGLATIADGWLDETPLFASRSMFRPQHVEADIRGLATLWLCFRALDPHLQAKGPRARWRPMMMDSQGLRLVRTTTLGHMPGWCPPVDIVGPYRPVRIEDPAEPGVDRVRLRAEWDGSPGLHVEATLRGIEGPITVACAGGSVELTPEDGRISGELDAWGAEAWQPAGYGAQPLYPVVLRAAGREFSLGRVGFRHLAVDRGRDGREFALLVNGEEVFCRGACWIAPDLLDPGADPEPTLRLAREAGMNMVRVSGVGLYESRRFFEVCDELGLLVWHDFMFANFDYPVADATFAAAVRDEAKAFLAMTQGCPSLAMLCGGSEVLQQATMMGLPADLQWPLFDEVLPQAAAETRPDVPYVPNTPWGGPLPFAADEAVTHYYGVGAYERPLEDARRADVKFASECLAFANVPQPETLARHLPVPAVHDPRWKAAVPRDRGASWDFEDTRDHYLGRLFELDPARLRREDPQLYLDLSRIVSGEVMAAVFAEWRRTRSPCAGGLVWTLRDLVPGAGWGVIDSTGEPKPAWYALKRIFQPIQALITDEGVNGLAVYLINETATPVAAEVRLSVLGADGPPVIDVCKPVVLEPRSTQELSAFALVGRFYDLSYAYRFGPRAHEAVRVQLVRGEGVLSEVFHFAGPRSGLAGGVVDVRLEGEEVVLTSSTLQRYVHISDAAFRPQDDGLPLAPGEPRRVRLVRRQGAPADARPQGEVLLPGGRVAGGY
ncbi:hypothetical protein [Phenylobacterium sp.]|jgi:beta-mannosidase|uniref:hypothetical protein n=1 Tax=Phenylobacterium sp. TaxID=1871053 RepID=UPI002F931E33